MSYSVLAQMGHMDHVVSYAEIEQASGHIRVWEHLFPGRKLVKLGYLDLCWLTHWYKSK